MLVGLFCRTLVPEPGAALFVKACPASFATQKRLASFNRKNGDEKQAHILIYSLKI